MTNIRVLTRGGHVITGTTEADVPALAQQDGLNGAAFWILVKDGSTTHSVRMASIEVVTTW